MKTQTTQETTRKAIAQQILEKISGLRNVLPAGQDETAERVADGLAYHLAKILTFVDRGAPVELVLPAFPAKSSNREKTLGVLPDLGEVLALERLDQLCEEIAEVYAPGARVILCSDGRVFSDLVQVSDDDVTAYGLEIQRIIDERGLKNLSTFNLEDLFSGLSHDETRRLLVERFAEPIETVRTRAGVDADARSMFNGIHRFLFEDLVVLNPSMSRTKVREWSGRLAYATIQRSNAWSNLVAEQFPEAVRLSIHPQPLHSRKIGIQMVPSENTWRTPWHSTAMFDGAGFKLVRRKDAEAMGAVLTRTEDGHEFFVAPGAVTGGSADVARKLQ